MESKDQLHGGKDHPPPEADERGREKDAEIRSAAHEAAADDKHLHQWPAGVPAKKAVS